ncbi:MAG: hypothetical protein RIQ81_2122 [Pseudomonadota bacterium]|jgi:hypothetical protein
MNEACFKKDVRSNVVVVIFRLMMAAVLVSISNPAVGARRDADEDNETVSENRGGSAKLLPGDIEAAVGAYLGTGQYHGQKFRNSPLKEQYSMGGLFIEVSGKRLGLMLASAGQQPMNVRPSTGPLRMGFYSDVSTAAVTTRLVLRPQTSAFVLRLGASHARRTFTLSDGYLEKKEESATVGPFAGFSLVATLGDHLSGDLGGSARILPVKIDILDFEDKGFQSEWSAGLTLRF